MEFETLKRQLSNAERQKLHRQKKLEEGFTFGEDKKKVTKKSKKKSWKDHVDTSHPSYKKEYEGL